MCTQKNIKPNSIWKESFRLITYKHIYAPKLSAPYHLHGFQTGSFYLYTERSRMEDSVKSGRAPYLEQKSALPYILGFIEIRMAKPHFHVAPS